jgi:hypothetical protein
MATIDQLALAHRLHDEGESYTVIAKAAGVQYQTARSWLDTEYRSQLRAKARERKAGYGGTCETCGSATDGSGGPRNAPRYCRLCAPAAHAKWGRDGVVSAIRRYYARYGRPPGAVDFNPAAARAHGRHDRAERFESDGDYPSTSCAQYVFGSWAAALTAAGFRPNPSGYAARAHDDNWTIEDAA